MALLLGGLLLRVLPSAFEGRAAVSGVGGLWFRCFANLASVLAPALTAPLIGHSDLLPAPRVILISRSLAVMELSKETL